VKFKKKSLRRRTFGRENGSLKKGEGETSKKNLRNLVGIMDWGGKNRKDKTEKKKCRKVAGSSRKKKWEYDTDADPAERVKM